MATQVKRRRGTAAQVDVFTGAEGEITVDSDTGRLRTHDALTPGGKKHALLGIANTFGGTQEFTNMPTVGGSPIVESGSNSNGYWVRYADGTQICWNDAVGTADTATSATGAWYRGSVTWTFPVAFNVAPLVASASDGSVRAGGNSQNATTTGSNLYHFAGAASATLTDIGGYAVGTWA